MSYLLDVLAGAVLLGAAHLGVSWNELLVVEEMVGRVLLRVGNPVAPEALASALGKKGNLVLAPLLSGIIVSQSCAGWGAQAGWKADERNKQRAVPST